MSRVRVNYKSDLPPIGVTFMLGDHEVPVPTTDFVVRFFVEGSPGPSFECIHKGEEYINCEVTSEDTLTCYINNHELGCGRLCCEFIDLSRNTKYADGVQKTVTPTKLDIVLVDGAGDDLVDITASVAIDIETIIGEIREAMEVLDGYADIIAALQAAVATIPNVIDDLETGGHTDALSAEQGKILKEILDNLGRISVEGIKGFTPISSLSELPENPTTEQKRQAYLFENALYVYVGAGGDTLGGKYQSVELVSLDWGDKSYNTSEFSGLGRRWLKKNMVGGENILTPAMISTDNTEYFIQYDYDLDGAEVTLPTNSSLIFMGGSIKNGTLIGSNTRIQAKKGECIFDDITIQGTWDVAEAYSSWFKTYKAGYRIASVKENGTTIDGVSYATFRVDGDSTDYVAGLQSVPGTFDYSSYEQYSDTDALQNLLEIRAKKTIIEEGVYMIKLKNLPGINVGLFYDRQYDSELVIDGWLKLYPNNYAAYNIFLMSSCKNVRITGKGGIQGDLLEHDRDTSEYGHVMIVTDTENLYVEGLTFAYAWGDCVYTAWWYDTSRTPESNNQRNHTYKNVSILYGRRTGYVSELGDNVVIDGCYFYGNGRVRGTSTNSAVDLEPFSGSTIAKRYVRNYEFKNNVFKNSANGLRTERCIDCSIHDNIFDGGWSGVIVASHRDAIYQVTPDSGNTDLGFIKGLMSIRNNNIRNCTRGIELASESDSQNIEVSNNTLISCSIPFSTGPSHSITDCRIFNNILYGCGQWYFYTLKNCDIYNNNCYACKMPLGSEAGGGTKLFNFQGFPSSSNTKFHDNSFSLDYSKSFYGLGSGDGKEELYHGPLVGTNSALAYMGNSAGVTLTEPDKISFYDNKVSDDFYLYYEYHQNFKGGINATKDESSEVFLVGDTFKSTAYGDVGVVTSGAVLSSAWLTSLNSGNGPREFEPGMTVSYGEIIKLNDVYKVCTRGGECGDSLTSDQGECGEACFVAAPAYLSGGTLEIKFATRGTCTSATRPSTFLFVGRRMYETDTKKNIIYDGSAWIEHGRYVGIVPVSGATPTQELAPDTYYKFRKVNSLALTLGAPVNGKLATYMFSFESASDESTISLPSDVKTASDADITDDFAANRKFLCVIRDNVMEYNYVPFSTDLTGWAIGKKLSSANALSDETDRAVSPYYAVTEGNSIEIKFTNTYYNWSYAVFTDATTSETVVSAVKFDAATQTLTVPEGASYVRFCIKQSDADDCYIKDKTNEAYLWKGKYVE